ncbi:DUF2797 domain-containing protein [Paeniglutamicibacter sp. ABSL32-1]|uniref:DUF2797 domain-containing protein n=1 Tax=Paeniglutamicibacter quisquiliarum TaxID=2849498 RepID=UPI001C2D7041|nr:DUF2797 domain-containing protein [Paeniglutamicibacter quisquiliarum]MBV1779885.1 DUF2797 domain-containing protein [Paeniglutamicibacter quisquiliarum]
MESTALLCRGIRWPASPGSPRLALDDAEHRGQDVALEPATRLGFTVLPGRWCLGHQLIQDRNHRTLVPCPHEALIAHGTQCAACEAADQSRAMHDFHRSGRAGPGLRDYLGQPHWLYVATFAQGTTKVGTAADPSKWRRLAEQGAISARYVAWCPDGASVRNLEDLVTGQLGFTQQVRANSKVRGLLENHDTTAGLDALNAARAASARSLIAGLGPGILAGSHAVEETWSAPEQGRVLLEGFDAHKLQPYPGFLGEAAHGFEVAAVSGQVLGVRLGGQPEIFVANAALLKGRKLALGDYVTDSPPVQGSLF